jgi:hypothetical protein
MTRTAAIALLGTLATPALAAGGELESTTWWVISTVYAFAAFLAVGLGFVLQGFLRLRNVTVGLTILCASFLTWLATVYGVEKTLQGLPEFALMLALFGAFFGLGWFLGMKDAGRRSRRMTALNAGSNHG